ncbi:hypothetical protein N7520_002466 [Penicillium odoratum]|uniref:uncharacterized protein n=1 Tax=Penicillium odoratum TaxID=1167516 RepID=UPI0025483B8A|nr:uncharacterized protein N7520_002466 [Penicillium odoratum]KAJ5771937.1 hypothetical protein N7520_002466 [Penicillium odoratum]
MAHQAHNIPWSLLASNLHWSKTSHHGRGVTNLRPSMKPNQGKELTYFIEAFIRTISDHSVCERKKFPSQYAPVDPTDVILEPVTVQKITPTVRKWRNHGFRGMCPSCICPVWKGEECRCIPIPDEAKKASAFLRPTYVRYCYEPYKETLHVFFNVEVVKTLLMHEEMGTILRICALPELDLKRWWTDYCECGLCPRILGWDRVCIKALRTYVCLNTIYCFPEIWNEASGRTMEMDYRNSGCYQFTLRTCTSTGYGSEVSSYPHRQFFGIGDNQFKGADDHPEIEKTHWLRWTTAKHRLGLLDYYFSRSDHCGMVPINEFLAVENKAFAGRRPGLSDVSLVQNYLYQKGLPVELVLDVMELAGYQPVGRLSEPQDPFHSSNRTELARYLTYCWRLLVNCDMMAKAIGMQLPWKELLGNCITDLWADDRYGHGRFFWWARDEYNALAHRVFIRP